MFGRVILVVVLVVFGLVILLGIGAAVAIAMIDPRSFLQERISRALDRPATIGGLQIVWGNPLKVELSDLRLGNASWGSQKDMVTVQHVSAVVDAKALLSGRLVYQKLVVVKPVIVLERNPDGVGNWRFGSGLRVDSSSSAGASEGGLAIIPKNRRQFPVLLDFTLQNAMISYRTYQGHILRIGLDQVKIGAPAEDRPVDIDADGSYNGKPVNLHAQAQSFDQLRDGTTPFGTTFSLKHGSARLDFTGTMMEPLDFEGVRGPMRIKAEKLNDLMGFFGSSLGGNLEGEATGDLTKQGNLWNWSDVKGQLGASTFTGSLMLLEGSRGKSDDIKTNLAFEQLDLDTLLAAETGVSKPKSGQEKSGKDWMELPLDVPDDAAPKIVAKLTAKEVKYGSMQVGDVDLEGQIGPQLVRLDQASFGMAGAKLRLVGAVEPAKEGGRLSAEVQAEDIDAVRLAELLGSSGSDLGGRIDTRLALAMQGQTLGGALKASNGGAVLAMQQGRISRDLLEKASTDLRTLFRKGKGNAFVSCLLGVMRIENGVGLLDPLRLRSPEATLNAVGRIDLAAQSVDITLQSEGKSTGVFALDIPLRISGNWRDLHIAKAGKTPDPKAAVDTTRQLPPALQQLAQQNSCNQ